jgi:hypothetical protein
MIFDTSLAHKVMLCFFIVVTFSMVSKMANLANQPVVVGIGILFQALAAEKQSVNIHVESLNRCINDIT